MKPGPGQWGTSGGNWAGAECRVALVITFFLVLGTVAVIRYAPAGTGQQTAVVGGARHPQNGPAGASALARRGGSTAARSGAGAGAGAGNAVGVDLTIPPINLLPGVLPTLPPVTVPGLLGPPNTAPPTTAPPTTAPPTTAPPTTLPPVVGTSYPTVPPAPICDNRSVLSGPAAPAAGWVRVDPSRNLNDVTQSMPPGTTFWLAPGTYSLGTDQFSQVIPKDHDVYLGAPGAIIDGRKVNRYAFTQGARAVTIKFLTIQNFVAPLNEGVVNHDSGAAWVIQANTLQDNKGAGVMIGPGDVVSYNCLRRNGQYGFNAYFPSGDSNVTLDHNEIAGNNTDNTEHQVPGCGCSGAGKFWNTAGAVVTDNWVHDNRGPGIWADMDNSGFNIEHNYIADNDGEGIVYEASYNARMANNTLLRNAIVKGKSLNAADKFPIPAIYISESGGDSRVFGGVYSTLTITGNFLKDNWGGVTLWENADRFCGSPSSGTSMCTLGGAAKLSTCVPGTIANQPYLSDCRWKTQNVSVTNNDFEIDLAAIGCTTQACGQQAVLSQAGSTPSWSPYLADRVQKAITFGQNNHFSGNRYVGSWRFTGFETGRFMPLAAWNRAPYNQDAGSSMRA